MFRTNIKVTKNNVPQVIKVVQAAEDSLPKNLTEATRDIAQDIVPVQFGFLQRSIRSVKVRNGLWQTTARSIEGGADRDYAHYVEYGTSKMTAQPFMGPAYRLMTTGALHVESHKFGVAVEIAAGL